MASNPPLLVQRVRRVLGPGGVSDCQRLASGTRSNSIRPVDNLHTSRSYAGPPSRPQNETSMKLGLAELVCYSRAVLSLTPQGCLLRMSSIARCC